MNKKISKNNFELLCHTINANASIDVNFAYDVYELAFESIDNLENQNILKLGQPINSVTLFYYIVGEYTYSIAKRDEEGIKKFNNSEKVKIQMASVVADKYMTSEMLSCQNDVIANKFLPPISSLDVYSNFMEQLLSKLPKNDPGQTLIIDLLNKSVLSMRCILKLLCDGFETEAMATWRTLHESECILLLLDKYGQNLVDAYLTHMKYAIAYHGGIASKEDTDAIFIELKGRMKEHDLKSKDMKKFIEYGWLYQTDGANENNFKLNFRDGLQKCAGLSSYSNVYEQSSEIVHSTPMLIYSNKVYYYLLTLVNTYESFFRIEEIFQNYCFKGQFESILSQYQKMKDVYYAQLVAIYKREMQRFDELTEQAK